MQKTIYLAEDEENIRELIRSFLENAGYQVRAFANGELLYHAFQQCESDLVILDIIMPGADGLTICSKLRAVSNVPIIVLTAKDSEVDYVRGITIGSDDYMTKPFSPTILMMKVEALLRRVEMERTTLCKSQNERVEFGDLVYSNEEKAVFCNETNLELTMTELQLLAYFIAKATNAVSRDELLTEVWGVHAEVETRVTDETIRRIRKKMLLARSTVQIQTIWGFGYKLILRKEESKR